MNDKNIRKVLYTKKELVRVVLDPFLETADIDRGNNYWPPKQQPTRFELFKGFDRPEENSMQRAKRAKERGK